VVRNAASADALRSGLPPQAPVSFVIADLGVSGTLVEALQRARIQPQSIDMAILCAGTKHDGRSVLELSRLRDTFEVNCFAAAELAAWWCSADPAKDSPRRLALISSIGRWHGMHGTAGYNASKAALSIWGESLDMELRSGGPGAMTVTIVEPGMFQSDMTATSGLAKLLAIPRRTLAARIVSAAAAGRRSLRPPLWFTLVTWAVCVAGRGFRYRLFSRVKPGK
jgi:NAD(P)-dependent dehydrogenase (short-subunit alcohol dehydrogenase family)